MRNPALHARFPRKVGRLKSEHVFEMSCLVTAEEHYSVVYKPIHVQVISNQMQLVS